MKMLLDIAHDTGAAPWAWWLSSMVKSTLWLALGLLAGVALRRQSASLRHGAALLTALGIPLIWLLNLSPIPETQGWQPARRWTASAAHAPMNAPTASAEAAEKNERGGGAFSPAPPHFPWRESLLAAWTLGGGFCALRLLAGAWRTRRERKHLTFLAKGRLHKIMAAECRQAGLSRCPALALGAASAMVAGWRRPVIALPAEAGAWPEAKTRAILRHELAHVARRDVLWAWLAEWALLPLWPHPLARALRRHLAESREQACDDAVLRSGVPAADYAENLLSLLPGAPALAAPARLWARPPGACARRFHHMLDPRASRHAATRWHMGALAALALPLLAAGTLLLGCAGPRPAAAPIQRFPQTNPERLPDLPRGSGPLNVDFAFFELSLPESQAAQWPAFATAAKNMGLVLSPEDGWQLFHPKRKGMDLLTAPKIGLRPGQQGKVEVVTDHLIPSDIKRNEATGKMEVTHMENVKTGVMADVTVRRGRTPRHIDLNLIAKIVECDGFHHDEKLGIPLPAFYQRGAPHEGEIENGSYIIMGAKKEERTQEQAVPGLARIPVIGKAFAVKTKEKSSAWPPCGSMCVLLRQRRASK